MTIQEAESVVKIMLTADGGCPPCVSRLLLQFVEKFPEFEKLCAASYKAEFENELR